MINWRLVFGLALCLAACGPVSAARPGARAAVGNITLRVEVTGVRTDKGRVHIDLCHEDEFLKDCPIAGDARAVKGTTVVVLTNLLPGEYAVQAFHDENSNGKVDRVLFGIPKEGVGFSNDAPIKLAPPKWSDAKFSLAADKTITLKLRFFL